MSGKNHFPHLVDQSSARVEAGFRSRSQSHWHAVSLQLRTDCLRRSRGTGRSWTPSLSNPKKLGGMMQHLPEDRRLLTAIAGYIRDYTVATMREATLDVYEAVLSGRVEV